MSDRQMQALARREFLCSLAGSAAVVSLAHVSRFAKAEDNKGASEADRRGSWSLVLPGKPSPVLEKAAQYLHDATGSTADYPATGRRDAEVVVRVDGRFDAEAGHEGFVIQSTSSSRIDVGGATADGAANGLFAMARRLKRETERDPFALQWDTSDAPRFEERGILFLHFLTQYTHLSVDGFTVADWRAYIDFLRSLGANAIGVLSKKYYSPAVPETDRYRAFYENMREAVRYAHQMGMRFHYLMPNNTVPSEIWWQNPELRAKTWGYHGHNLCPHFGLERIRESQRPFAEFFKEMDTLGYMFVDGGADCHCAYCENHRAEVILGALDMAGELLADVGSKAKVRAITWGMDRRPGKVLEQVAKAAAPDVSFLDAAYPSISGGRTGYGIAKQMGRQASNVLYLTDPEGGMETQLSVFPFPRIAETKKEIDRSRREDVDGIDGWRLAPVVRFISDNLVLRWAWNPEVDARRAVQDIVEESVSQAEQRTALGEAIWTLEEFGQTMNLDALRRADELFTEVCRLKAPQAIRHTAEGVRVLLAVAELAFETKRRPTMEDAKAIFELMAESEIYQGYTTDQAWIGRSCTVILLPMLTEWVHHLRQLAGTKP